MLYLCIVKGLGGKPLIRILFKACLLLHASLFSLYILSCIFVSLYLSAFVRPALFVLTHLSRCCACMMPSFFRISRTVMSWNFANTSLLISPAWKSMLHESFRNLYFYFYQSILMALLTSLPFLLLRSSRRNVRRG